MSYTLIMKKMDGTEERIPNLDEFTLERIIAQLGPDIGVHSWKAIKEKEKEDGKDET